MKLTLKLLTRMPAIKEADVPDTWIAAAREAYVRLEGVALRGGEFLVSKKDEKPPRCVYTIAVQNLNTGEFHAVMLPGDGYTFATAEDRNAVLKQLQEGAPSKNSVQ